MWHIDLHVDLACQFCKSSITRALKKGIKPLKMKICIQPFAQKWANHRELGKVRFYHDIHLYLGETITEGDILTDTSSYIWKDYTAKSNGSNTVNCNISLSDSTNEFVLI